MKKPLITPHKAIRAFGTQRELAEAMGVTQQAVSKWKMAREMPVPMQRLALRLVFEKIAADINEDIKDGKAWKKSFDDFIAKVEGNCGAL